MKINELVDDAQEKVDALTSAADAVDEWLMDDYDARRKGVDDKIAAFSKSFQLLCSYQSSLELAAQSRYEKSREIGKQQRARRSLISDKLISGGAPKPLANFIASHLEQRKGPTWKEPAFIQSDASSSAGYSTALTAVHDFTNPAVIIPSASEDKLPIEKAIAAMLNDMDEKRVQKEGRAIDHMISTRDNAKQKVKTHVAAPLDSYALAVESDEKTFGSKAVLKEPILVVQRAWAYTNKNEGNPMAGMPSIIQCTKGVIWVTMLDIEYILNFSKNLLTLHELLSCMETEQFAKHVSCILSPGSAAWCPAGYVPLVVAIGAENDRVDELRYSAWVQYCILDAELAASMNRQVAVEMKSWWESGMEKGLKVFTASESCVQDFIKRLKAVVQKGKVAEPFT